MTCWPPGTTAKRWVIQAERVIDVPIDAAMTTVPGVQ